MGRAPCCSKVGLHRGPWTAREDALLASYIHTHGEGSWKSLPKKAGLLRCGKSCRLRWMNYLRPDIKRGNIGPEEEDLIVRLHCLLGNRWSLIAGRLPGRTDNEIKNYWNSHLSKKLRKQGFILREGTHRCKRPESSNKKKNTKIDSSISTKQSAETAGTSNKRSEADQEVKIYAPKPTRFFPRMVRNNSKKESSEEVGFEAAEEEKGSPESKSLFDFSWSDSGGEEANYTLLDQQETDIQVNIDHDFLMNDAVLDRFFHDYSELLQSEVDYGPMNQYVY